jgi:hypothetical protein
LLPVEVEVEVKEVLVLAIVSLPRSIWLRYFLAPAALKFLRHRSSA